jgi:hypothetical protein
MVRKRGTNEQEEQGTGNREQLLAVVRLPSYRDGFVEASSQRQ